VNTETQSRIVYSNNRFIQWLPDLLYDSRKAPDSKNATDSVVKYVIPIYELNN